MVPSRTPSCRPCSPGGSRLSLALALGLGLVFAGAGCGSDSPSGPDDDSDPGADHGTVTALIGGMAWSAEEVTTTYFQDRINFVGDDDEWRISVQVRGFTGPGTYALHDSDPIVTIHLIRRDGTGVWGGVSSIGTGQVTITSASATRAVGTFSGVLPQSPGSHTAIDTVVVSNGVFDVPR